MEDWLERLNTEFEESIERYNLLIKSIDSVGYPKDEKARKLAIDHKVTMGAYVYALSRLLDHIDEQPEAYGLLQSK